MDGKVILYSILQRDSALALSEDVKDMLGLGFELYGSPFCTPAGVFCQAMVERSGDHES